MGLPKCFWNQWEKRKHRKTTLLAKSKLNSIEKMISKGLIDFDNSLNEFQLPINYEQFLFILDWKKQSVQKIVN